ncbi:MAG TPA: ABC transporter ATP-binding protein [Acidimicrobiia bacterium]|nr:ABC transporter ATP-binding protein [Acidimicrobiia bacterium]
MSEAAIALRTVGLTKSFRGLEVLRGVDLTVGLGTTHAVIGPNGAGKTTLFNILSGAIPPSAGRVELRGRDVTGWAPHQLLKLGLGRSFQVTSVFPALSVEANLRVAAQVKGPDGLDERVETLLDQLALRAMRHLEAGVLSHGDQRRLDIGLTLASEPAIVLLDEPTAGMTRTEAQRTMETLERILAGRTIVLVEHDMDLVMRISARVSVLHRGILIADGPPEAVRENREVREAYLVGVGRE